MKNRARAVPATALALIMATPYAAAFPQGDPPAARTPHPHVLLAQAEECPADDPDCAPATEQAAPAEDERPAEEPGSDEEPATDEPEPTPEDAPVPEQSPVQPDIQPLPEAVPVPEEPPSDAEPLPDEPLTEETAPPAEETVPAPEDAPAAEEAPAETPPAEEIEQLPDDVPVPEQAPTQAAPAEEAEPAPEDAPAGEETPAETPPAEETEPLPDDVPVPEQAPTQAAPAAEAEPAPEDAPAAEEAPAETLPAEETEPLPQDPAADNETQAPADEQVAPILDSQKEEAIGEDRPAETAEEPVEAGPPPASDAEAQQFDEPVDVLSVREEEGRRVERSGERRSRREGESVLREIGDRIVIQLNNQIVVQSDDRGRIGRDADEVYYEELPRGRLRETVVRPNGVQVVTVYDRYGDVVRRSRIMPDGREYVLVYADRRDREARRDWRDPGLDLPPLRLTIPMQDYVLDAGRVREPDAYYDFFRRPPVEPVRRLYTVDEVRYSARVRDSVRRVELDTITFDFGSASIADNEVARLETIATAIDRLLDDNPAETFLIEGHTDAVGSDEANLALSDRRAEAVAVALTSVFDIPPENLVTQGYGERYLKIDTQQPERQNRRVVMRRITPLVAPAAGLR